MSRLLVVGLDCAPPALVFERYAAEMPHLAALIERGFHGPLRSTEPPITVPAWASMTSGYDPGELGLYGFRNRRSTDYRLDVARSDDLRHKRVWDRLGESGKRVAVLFVPLTSPPTPVRGQMVSCFLWPGEGAPYTFPRSLASELEARFGAHEPDVPDFRTDALDRLMDDLKRTTRKRFDIARYIWREKRPDFAMMVEMGPDRFHHAFWQHIDPTHPRHPVSSPFAEAGREYYAFLDQRLGELCAEAGEDTDVLIVSDHGARSMMGGVAVNDLLRERGLLSLRSEPKAPIPLAEADVDWERTLCWAEGGYYARIFLNVRGREPNGVIESERYESERDRIRTLFEDLKGPDGGPLSTWVAKPEERYRKVRGHPPDLFVYLDDLSLRSVGTVGHDTIHLEADDRGPDGCNHDWNGIVVGAGPSIERRGRIDGSRIFDIAPTVLDLMAAPIPADLVGRSLIRPR